MLASTPSDLPLFCVACPATGCHTNRRPRSVRSLRSKRIFRQGDRQGVSYRVCPRCHIPCAAPQIPDRCPPRCVLRSVPRSGSDVRSRPGGSLRRDKVDMCRRWVKCSRLHRRFPVTAISLKPPHTPTLSPNFPVPLKVTHNLSCARVAAT